MTFLLKRFSLSILLLLALVSFGCHKNVPAPAPAPTPAPPPPPPPAAPTVSLSANTTTITRGGAVTLTYSSTGATNVTIDQGVGAVTPAANGTRQVTPTAATTYTATATGPGGTAQSARVAIAVNAPPPPVVAAPPPAPPAPVVNRGPVRTAADIFRDTMVPILFDYDKSAIRSSEEPKLLAIAAYLKQTPATRFTIEGHADERGGQEYNIALGDDRASAVKKYLAGQGVVDSRMNTVSYGEEKPICRDETEDCWQRNRRAAFVMVP